MATLWESLQRVLAIFSVHGILIHFVIAMYFAIHAVRHGRSWIWLCVLFVLPFLGSGLYFFAVCLPTSRLEAALRQGSSETMNMFNPNQELRDARRACALTSSVHNQMRLGNALLAAGQAKEALQVFEACLAQVPSDDWDLRLAAARAQLESGQAAQAIVMLREIRTHNPDFNVPEVTLLAARALAATDQAELAQAQFEFLIQNYSHFEGRVEYAVWLVMQQDFVRAKSLGADIEQTIAQWPKHARYLNKQLIRKFQRAFNGLSDGV